MDRKRIFFSNEFERNGLFGIVNFYEFNLSLISIESDLFSLELPSSSFKVCYYEAYNMAKALWQLQSLYGLIPTTFCIGNASQEVDKHYKYVIMGFEYIFLTISWNYQLLTLTTF